MPITPLPTPPSTADRANFDERADDFLSALPQFQAEANALEANVNAKEASTTQAVADAMAAGLADAADNAAATAADRVQTGQDRIATAADAQRAEDAAAAAEAIVGFPAPMPEDIGKFLGVGPGQEMDWFPAGVRMVTEYLTSGTSWTAPANLVGGRVKYRAVGGGGGGGRNNSSIMGMVGGNAGYCEGIATVAAGTAYPYAIGAGGAGSTADSTAGSAGGATTMFGFSAGGGLGGVGSSPAIGAAGVQSGGAATGADINLSGGSTGITGTAATSFAGFSTGPTPFGVYGGATSATVSYDSTGYGVGGAGARGANAQAGRPGLIELTYLVSI